MSTASASELEYVEPTPSVSYVVTALAMYTALLPVVEYIVPLCHKLHQPHFDASVSQCGSIFQGSVNQQGMSEGSGPLPPKRFRCSTES